MMNRTDSRTAWRGGQDVPGSHGDHTDRTRPAPHVKQDWRRLYRAAVLGYDRSKLLQRIEDAEGAILKRSRSSLNSPGNDGKEQDALTRALHILSLLREAAGEL